MANCYLLEADQKQTDRPRRIKRSGGQSLVRQMKAFWIKENVLLQMFDQRHTLALSRPVLSVRSPALPAHSLDARPYIPESMPPVIDKRLGVRFEDPVKAPGMPRFRRIWSGEKYNQPLLPNGCEARL
jgi:hypothetical protein